MLQIKFKKFKAIVKSWDTVFQEAAEFATTVGPDRVVSISHSSDHGESIVTVWYWAK
jgi:hypothetical protein